MTAGPFMNELLTRLQYLDADAALTAAGDGLTWHDDNAAVVTLITSEHELAHAVRSAGRDVRDDLWPGSSLEDAGFNLLLVHLDELLATRDVTEPLRLTREGLIWPEPRPLAFEDQLDPNGGPYYWSAEKPGGEGDPAGDSRS
jgi:hypothetical protein